MTTEVAGDTAVPIDIFNPSLYLRGLPHDQYAYLRQRDPCHLATITDPALIDRAWVLSRYDDIKPALSDAKTFASAQAAVMIKIDPAMIPPNMLLLDGAAHARNRGLIRRGFTPRVVRTFEEHVRTLVREVLDAALARDEFDFLTDIAMELPLRAIANLVGVPFEDRHRVLGWLQAVVAVTEPEYSGGPEAVMAAHSSLMAFWGQLIEQRRQVPQDDLLTELVTKQGDDALSEEEIQGFLVLLTSAGSNTVRNSLAHGLLALIQHPDQMRWLRDHVDDESGTAVEEILRWASPTITIRRRATRTVEMHDKVINAGDDVVMLMASANFDPDKFVDPFTFDLTREPNLHMAFGWGTHTCLGAHLARLEIRSVLDEFLARVRDVRLAGSVEYGRDASVRRVKHLPIHVELA